MAGTKDTEGFSADELAAMRQRAAELREEARGGSGSAKKQREAKACDEAIAALTGTDAAVAQMLHRVVREHAPHLDPKTWYGFPSYARDGKVVVFYQPASKFDTRYGTIGFQHDALLDDGAAWPTAYAVVEVTDEVETQFAELVRRAAG